MAVRTPDEILDITRKIRAGEIVDEALTEVLIDITDTVNELNGKAEQALAAADEANAAARTAKEANAELYARITAVEVDETTEEAVEVEPLEYEDLFESEDK